MELPDWLEQFADSSTRESLRPLYLGAAGAMAEAAVKRAAARSAAGPLTLEQLDPHDLLNSRGWDAIGAFDASERSRVLDALGFDAQLVFPTFAGSQFSSTDLDLLYGGTDALNRAMQRSAPKTLACSPSASSRGAIPLARSKRHGERSTRASPQLKCS